VQLTELYLRALSPLLHKLLGIYLPLITTNCAVLGLVLLAEQRSLSLLNTLLFALGAALGFSLVLAVFAALRERLQHSHIPQAFRGTPIALITAGFLSLGFLGLTGMGAH
jgi:electron transport complex protein RnfA